MWAKEFERALYICGETAARRTCLGEKGHVRLVGAGFFGLILCPGRCTSWPQSLFECEGCVHACDFLQP